jgi:hypothetical protein
MVSIYVPTLVNEKQHVLALTIRDLGPLACFNLAMKARQPKLYRMHAPTRDLLHVNPYHSQRTKHHARWIFPDR